MVEKRGRSFKMEKLTETPKGGRGFLGFPVHTDLNNLDTDIAVSYTHLRAHETLRLSRMPSSA